MMLSEIRNCSTIEAKCSSLNLALALAATIANEVAARGEGVEVHIECPIPNAAGHPSINLMCEIGAVVYRGGALCRGPQSSSSGYVKRIVVSEKRIDRDSWAKIFLVGAPRVGGECSFEVVAARGVVAILWSKHAEIYRIKYGALEPCDLDDAAKYILEVLEERGQSSIKSLVKELKGVLDRYRVFEILGMLQELKIVEINRGLVTLKRRVRRDPC